MKVDHGIDEDQEMVQQNDIDVAKIEVSVLICTYNGGARLKPVVEHLAKQTGLEPLSWELIIVDNASTDSTPSLLTEMTSEFPVQVSLHQESTPGKAHALETAFQVARGKYYCIVDDDNWLESDYLANGVKFLQSNPDVAVIGGRTRPMFPRSVDPPVDFEERFAPLLACRDHGSSVIWGFRPPGAGQMGRATLMRQVYQSIGTRLEDRVGEGVGCCEDLEKCGILARLGWKTAYVPDLRLHHVMTARRLTNSYIDDLACAAVQTSAWLRLVANSEPMSVPWQAYRSVSYSAMSLKYWLLSWLPERLHPKLGRASHWRRYYASRAAGYRTLLLERGRVMAMVEAIDHAPEELCSTNHGQSVEN